MLSNLRLYGTEPYSTALIHGGPGAAGEMAPVARELSRYMGVIEPLQTEDTIEGQVRELKETLECCAAVPVTLVGHSWGAWLAMIFTSRYPDMVKKLILVASSPFEEEYAERIMPARFLRMSDIQKRHAAEIMKKMSSDGGTHKNDVMREFGLLLEKIDSFDPREGEPDDLVFLSHSIMTKVQSEAQELRRSGRLLDIVQKIHAPVVAIHGDYDPHPYEGVKIPLSNAIGDFRFILLEKCGHTPWIENHSREEFFSILRREIQ